MAKQVTKLTAVFAVVCALLALLDIDIFNPLFILVVLFLSCLSLLPSCPTLSPSVWRVLNIGALLLFFADLFLFSENLIFSAIHLLYYVLVNRLYQRTKRERDLLQVLAVALALLMAAAAFSTEITFFFYLSGFLVAALEHVIAQHYVRMEKDAAESTPAGGRPAVLKPVGYRVIVRNGLLGGAGILIPAVLLFFAFPRIGTGFFQGRGEKIQRISGFSEKVDLNEIGRIKVNSQIVMRVEPETMDERIDRISFWRGVAFHFYDGKSWQRFRTKRDLPRRAKNRYVAASATRFRQLLACDYAREPILSSVLFAAPTVIDVEYAQGPIRQDPGASLFFDYPPLSRTRYRAVSAVDRPDPAALRRDRQPLPANMDRYLQLPTLDPRVAALAKTASAGADNNYDRALRIERYLKENFTYSLDIRQDPALMPLENFLFRARRGHCEFFATSMVVMLRTLGIPARLVNGFQKGEWNALDHYFIVRQKHAHAWVEVFFPSWGWVEFDPTPPGEEPAARSAFVALLYDLYDAARFKWDRYVILYSLSDQIEVLLRIREGYRRFSEAVNEIVFGSFGRLRRLKEGVRFSLPVAVAVGGAFGAAGAFLMILLRRRRVPRRSYCGVKFYAKALLILQTKGFRRPAGTTAREFARIIPGTGGVLAARLTDDYYRVRFGREEMTQEQRQAVDRELRELKAWKPRESEG
jgi:transglutaminase-like putative cysteine protease